MVNFNEYRELESEDIDIELPEIAVNKGLRVYRETDGEVFFETRDKREIPITENDEIRSLSVGESKGRFDLLSARSYQTAKLWWAILDANDIVDPFDLPDSIVIRIPHRLALFGEVIRI